MNNTATRVACTPEHGTVRRFDNRTVSVPRGWCTHCQQKVCANCRERCTRCPVSVKLETAGQQRLPAL